MLYPKSKFIHDKFIGERLVAECPVLNVYIKRLNIEVHSPKLAECIGGHPRMRLAMDCVCLVEGECTEMFKNKKHGNHH